MSIGPVLGTYNIMNRLSVGGMGEVYLAEDTRLDRKVALKVLPPEWGGDSERLERFQWEARVLATLNHPNIVTIYSVEKHDGVHFFTMELVEGETLREKILDGKGMVLSQFLELAVPLADALSAAHQRGIIHRDLKPGNIMVRPDGRLKILDFGLAKREPGNGNADAAREMRAREPQTQDGRLLGTVAYMSPEQMGGRPIDHRADLFTLGIVFYEMLTGVRPFEETHWADKITNHLHESDPGAAPPEAQLPERLEEIIHRCLERDPDRRYQTAEELREDLTELQLEIVSGSFSSTQIARPDFGRPKRLWIAALAGAAVVFAIVAGFLAPRFLPLGAGTSEPAPGAAAERKTIAVEPFRNQGSAEDDYFAIGITEEIVSRLASVSALKVIRAPAGSAAPDASGPEAEPRAQTHPLGASYLLGGTVFWSGDEEGRERRVRVIPLLTQTSDGTHLWSERYEYVLDDILRVQSEIAEEVLRQLNIRLLPPERRILSASHTDSAEAYEAYLRAMEYASRHEPSAKNWELAVGMLERAVRFDPEFAPAHAELSRVHSFIYHLKIDRTISRLDQALAAAERALEIAPNLPDGHRALGFYYYWGRSDYDRALREFYTAVRMVPNDSQLFEGIAYVRRRQGRFEEALENFEMALELNPKSNWLAAEMAHTYTNLRRYAEAERYYDLAIALAPDQPHPYQLKALNVLRWSGDLDRARAILHEMPRQDETSSLYSRSKVELMAGRLDAAEALIQRITSDLIGLDSALFPKEISLGTIRFLRGDFEQARLFYDSSRKTLERKVRERPDDARLRSTLGLTYAALTFLGEGYKDDAIRQGEKAMELYPVENDAFVGPEYVEHLAVIYAWVGEHDTSLDLVERILAVPSGLSPAYLRVNIRWQPLRGHPRYERLVADHL